MPVYYTRTLVRVKVTGPLYSCTLFCYHLVDMELADSLREVLPFIQIVLAILLIATILLQQRGSSLGGAFGGDNFSSAFQKRRGAELFLFKFSIGLAVLFALSAFLPLVL